MKMRYLLIVLLVVAVFFYGGGRYWGFDTEEAHKGSIDAKVEDGIYEYEQRKEIREEALDDVRAASNDGNYYFEYEYIEYLLKECLREDYSEFRDMFLNGYGYYTHEIVEGVIREIQE